MTLRAAIIGAGRRGRTHTKAVADLESTAQIVAIADIDPSRAQTLIAEDAPYASPFTDYTRMLAETHPDVVYVTSPPPLHREQVLAAFAAGAHVVLEKPIALTNEDAEAIGEAAERSGRLIHICHQQRYSPGITELRQILAGQSIALTNIWNYRKGPDIPGNWSRAWGGGHVVEWGIHYLDLTRYLLNTEPVEVYARYADQILHGQPTWDNWDAYSLTLQWSNGAVGSYASTYALKPGIPFGVGLTIIAADGQATIGNGVSWTTPEETLTWPSEPVEAERELSRAFFQAITTSDHSAIRQTFADALLTHRLVLAANHSAAEGRPIPLSRREDERVEESSR